MRIGLWELDERTDCYHIWRNRPIWEPGKFGKKKNLENLFGSHQRKKINKLENRSGSHSIM
jgi:hypothetical protein